MAASTAQTTILLSMKDIYQMPHNINQRIKMQSFNTATYEKEYKVMHNMCTCMVFNNVLLLDLLLCIGIYVFYHSVYTPQRKCGLVYNILYK